MRFNPGGRAAALSLILAASLAGAPAHADVDVAGVRVPCCASGWATAPRRLP